MTRSKFHQVVERVFELSDDLDEALSLFPPLDEDEIKVITYLGAGSRAKALYVQWLEAQTETTESFNKLEIKS